jgi:hypothetical protein
MALQPYTSMRSFEIDTAIRFDWGFPIVMKEEPERWRSEEISIENHPSRPEKWRGGATNAQAANFPLIPLLPVKRQAIQALGSS